MKKTRYNWSAIIQAVAYLTDEPATNGLDGNGFSITRSTDDTLTLTITEGEYGTPDEASTSGAVTPETPNPLPIVSPVTTGNPEALTPPIPSVPVDASESAATTVDTDAPIAATPTGQGGVVSNAVPTGQ